MGTIASQQTGECYYSPASKEPAKRQKRGADGVPAARVIARSESPSTARQACTWATSDSKQPESASLPGFDADGCVVTAVTLKDLAPFIKDEHNRTCTAEEWNAIREAIGERQFDVVYKQGVPNNTLKYAAFLFDHTQPAWCTGIPSSISIIHTNTYTQIEKNIVTVSSLPGQKKTAGACMPENGTWKRILYTGLQTRKKKNKDVFSRRFQSATSLHTVVLLVDWNIPCTRDQIERKHQFFVSLSVCFEHECYVCPIKWETPDERAIPSTILHVIFRHHRERQLKTGVRALRMHVHAKEVETLTRPVPAEEVPDVLKQWMKEVSKKGKPYPRQKKRKPNDDQSGDQLGSDGDDQSASDGGQPPSKNREFLPGTEGRSRQ